MDVSNEVAAAAAVRRLGHALVAHRVEATLLARVAARADGLAEDVEASPPRERDSVEELAYLAVPVAPNGPIDHTPWCWASGRSNPLGLGLAAERVDAAVHATVVLGPAVAGVPGIAHGGVVAALVDEVMGFVLSSLQRTVGYTVSLEIRYRAPVPIGEPIDIRGQMVRREGRKLFMAATVERNGAVLADAHGVFIAVDRPITTARGPARARTDVPDPD